MKELLRWIQFSAILVVATVWWNHAFANGSTPISPPAYFTVTPEDDGINPMWLSWPAVSGATAYEVDFHAEGVGAWQAVPGGPFGSAGTKTHYGLDAGTRYYYRLRAYKPSPVNYSTYLYDDGLLLPDAPTNVHVTNVGSTQMTLEWDDAHGASHYSLYVQPYAGGAAIVNTNVNFGVESYPITGLTANTRYYIHIQSYNATGAGESAWLYPYTATNPPAAPDVTPLFTDKLKPTWGAVTGATSYKVYRASSNPQSEGSFALRGSTSNLYYIDSGMSAGTTYYYRIKTVNQNGDSDYSNYGAGTTMPTTPQNFHVADRAPYSVTFAWDDVDGETGYYLEGYEGESYYTDIDPDESEFEYTNNMYPGSLVSDVRIRWYNSYGNGSWTSPYLSAYAAPETPASLAATPVSHQQINLSWPNVEGETGYRIERRKEGVPTWSPIATKGINVTSHQDNNGLEPATLYHYRVYPYNQGGDGGYAETSAWTLAAVPTGFVATQATVDSITLHWTDVAVEAGYTIEEDHYTHGIRTIGTPATDQTTFVADQDLESGKTLQYRIRANHPNGNSLWSNWIEVKTPPAGTTAELDSVVLKDITLDWTNIEGEEWYAVHRSLDGANWTTLTTITADPDPTSYLDENTDYATTYQYCVLSYVENDPPLYHTFSSPSNVVTAKTAPVMTAVSVDSIVEKSVTLGWADAAGEDGYQVSRSTDGETWTTVASALDPGTTSFTDAAPYYDTTYQYKVCAYSSNSVGNALSVASAVEAEVDPKLEFTIAPDGGITVSWGLGEGVAGVTIQRRLDGGEWIAIAGNEAGNEGTFTDSSGYFPGGTYEYRVLAPDMDPVVSEPQTSASAPSIALYDLVVDHRDPSRQTVGAIDADGRLFLGKELKFGQTSLPASPSYGAWVLRGWKDVSGVITEITAAVLQLDGDDRGTLSVYGNALSSAPTEEDLAFMVKTDGGLKAGITHDGDIFFAGSGPGFKALPTPDDPAAEFLTGPDRVHLSWDYPAGTGATDYYVERSLGRDFESFQIVGQVAILADPAPRGFNDSHQLDSSDDYYYRVRAVKIVDGAVAQYSLPSEVVHVFLPADQTLPWGIAVRSLSPIFPTPNSFANLPQRYKEAAFQGQDPANLANISGLEILSMFVYYPNMRWNDRGDGFKQFGIPKLDALRARNVNTGSGEWGRPTFNSDGVMYLQAADPAGQQHGFSLFNRQVGEGFSPLEKREINVFNSLAELYPGVYSATRDEISPGQSRGKLLAWHPKTLKINPYREEPLASHLEQRPWGCTLLPGGQLWLAGDLYYSFFNPLAEDANGEFLNELEPHNRFRVNPDVGGILRIKNVDTWGNQQPFDANPHGNPANYKAGNEWEKVNPPTGTFSNVKPDSAGVKGYLHIMKPNGGEPYSFERLRNPTMADPEHPTFAEQIYDPTNGTDNLIWKNGKFANPAFIQFGKGYEDYHEPDPGAVLSGSQVYVYAVSTYKVEWGSNALYLGRSRVRLPETSVDAQWEPWEYYVGAGLNGRPLWSTDVDLAKSILYGQSAMGRASVIYERHSKLYLLSTFGADNTTIDTRNFWRYRIYAARRPWGPWRQVFANDYNGMTNRAAQDMRFQGGTGFDIHILGDFVTVVPDSDPLRVRFWVSMANWPLLSPAILYGRTGQKLASTDLAVPVPPGLRYDDDPGSLYSEIAPWDEYFKQIYYNLNFQEIELTAPADLGDPPDDLPAVVQQFYPTYRMEGQFHYDHWGWRPVFDDDPGNGIEDGTVVDASFSLDPKWYGHRFRVGPQPIAVNDLGRFYVSGNSRPHALKLMKITNPGPSETVAEIAAATVDPAALGADLFNPPAVVNESNGTRLDADGYIYAPIADGPVTLTASDVNGTYEYYLLSREGIAGASDPVHAAEMVTLPAEATPAPFPTPEPPATAERKYMGYRFRTGPLGLRVTKIYVLNSLVPSTERKVIIARADNQIINFGDPLTIYEPPTGMDDLNIDGAHNKAVVSVINSQSTTLNELNLDFAYADLPAPFYCDLEPLTDYYIGVQVEANDDCYPAIDPSSLEPDYERMVKMRFNPNAFQFFHPARITQGAPSAPLVGEQYLWESVTQQTLPSVQDVVWDGSAWVENPYDDGVTLSPAVEYPVFFDFIVPDRFEGYRSPAGTGVLNAGTGTMERKPNPSNDRVSMPVLSTINTHLESNIKVLGPAMTERNGRYGDQYFVVANPAPTPYPENPEIPVPDPENPDHWQAVDPFLESAWSGALYFRTFGMPNSTFGPLDAVFKKGTADYNLIGGGEFSEETPPNLDDCYYNPDDFANASANLGARVDVYENNRFSKPNSNPVQWPYGYAGIDGITQFETGIYPGIYSGMHIKVLDEDIQLTKVGRYFPPGLDSVFGEEEYLSEIATHQVVVVRARDSRFTLMAVGTFTPGDYNSSTGGFIYTTSLVNPVTSDPPMLRRGEAYIIAVWDYKNSAVGKGLDEMLEGRQFGLIEDYVQFKTGSGIKIVGPVMADDAAGAPINPKTIWLDPSDSTGFPQGFGPLNFKYESASQSLFPSVGGPEDATTDFKGYRGIMLTVGDRPVKVTQLGRYKSTGNDDRHQVVIVKKALGDVDETDMPSEIVSSVMVDASGAAEADGYTYARLQNPVVLERGQAYIVASYEDFAATPQTGDTFLLTGTATPQTGSGLWGAGGGVENSGTANEIHVYTMDPAVGQWNLDSTNYAPIVNLKLN
jgi:fibronectin type 3 domain-containing protein